MRQAEKERITTETQIFCKVIFDSSTDSQLDIPIPFLRHMLELFAKFSRISLVLRAKGDIDIDIHHLNEDLAIVLGQTILQALGDRRGLRRIGASYVPMDEALTRVVIDLSGRPYLIFNVFVTRLDNELDYSMEYVRQFFVALSNHLKANIHVDLLRGRDFHHVIESVFKSLGLALFDATRVIDKAVPSTKGHLD